MDHLEAIQAAGAQMARDVAGMPLQRAYEHAFDVIEAAREYGFSWLAITDALAMGGVTGKDGGILTPAYVRVLHSTAASKRRQAAWRAARGQGPAAPDTPAPASRRASKGGGAASPLGEPPTGSPKAGEMDRFGLTVLPVYEEAARREEEAPILGGGTSKPSSIDRLLEMSRKKD